ncbi:hypothetical protein CSAL01_13247 [Colletotrichum salicis]|uniref:Uncharacterized protein n=1 Tax=Colletotrichum salicis TaxID=1209931 RepID=A0A135UTK5_9PEZI|nr:hypothetical protein CSAL01_13247 [Colletotrichum salicis]
MKVTTILAAFLPVLALAQTSSGDMTTVTSTATQTKTITLERAHTTTMTYGTGNSTATFKPTGSVVASATAAATAATTSKASAGAVLNAGNLAFAGVADGGVGFQGNGRWTRSCDVVGSMLPTASYCHAELFDATSLQPSLLSSPPTLVRRTIATDVTAAYSYDLNDLENRDTT